IVSDCFTPYLGCYWICKEYAEVGRKNRTTGKGIVYFKSMNRYLFILLLSVVLSFSAAAQKGVTTFGLQYKPIVPNTLIGFFEQDFDDPPFYSTVKQKFGHSAGMMI